METTETKLDTPNKAIPLIPWPDVHPIPNLDPNAITAPPITALTGETTTSTP
ncbi:hypothetical protein Vi05172_g9268 [Venturia inaequalis]|nr:hypothetical protein Vi05172_g9268 [Venturia inaequalis]